MWLMPAVNKYKPHLYVIPEDDADRQIVNGFAFHHGITSGSLQVMPIAGGWAKVIETINDEYVPKLRNSTHAHVLGVIDCDEDTERIPSELAKFPDELRDRIFLLGPFDEPEAFKKALNKQFQVIGELLANECYSGEFEIWNHEHLAHIANEIQRANGRLNPVLFGEPE
jgi:hypothetical protein